MDLVLTIVIGLLIFYLFCKKIFKKKVSKKKVLKKEEYTDPIQAIVDEMKKKNSMDILGEYFYVTLGVGYRNNERVKQAYADQEARLLYGDKLDKIKSFIELSELNLWWNTQDKTIRRNTYLIKYKQMISDGIRFSYILQDENDKDTLNLIFENSPLKENPAVVRAYKKRRKEIYTPLVDGAIERIKTGNNGRKDLDYFNQIPEDILDFSETDDYLTSWNKKSLRFFYIEQLKFKLSNFLSGGKPNESGLNSDGEKQMAYYTWLTELENYWLRLPEWVRTYNEGKSGSMKKTFQFNWKLTNRRVQKLYTYELGLKYELSTLTEFHNKAPQRVRMFPLYQTKYKAVFTVVYGRSKDKVLEKIDEAKNRNILVDFRKRCESDVNYQGFFGVGDNVHDDTPNILIKFWRRYDDLTSSGIDLALQKIKDIVEKAREGVSVFFELLREWEELEKIPTKEVGDENVPDPYYSHYNWISKLHKGESQRNQTQFTKPSTDTVVRRDEQYEELYNVYTDYVNEYKDLEYNMFSDSMDITVDGDVAGLTNITTLFTDNYFRNFIFKNPGVYSSTYKRIENKWNEVFTDVAIRCFPESTQDTTQDTTQYTDPLNTPTPDPSAGTVKYTWYKARWEAIIQNKYYHLITYENVAKIEQAYTSNPEIKEQVINEIGSLTSIVKLESFINMLPQTFKDDQSIQQAYEVRVVESLEEDMKSYSSMVPLLEYWIAVKEIFRKLQAVQNLFHNIARDLVRKKVIGEKIDVLTIEWEVGSNIKTGTGIYNVNDLMIFWVSIMDYKVIQNKAEYEEIIKTHLRYLFPLEVGNIRGVNDLAKYWFDSHKFIRKRYRQITWNTFVTKLEQNYKADMSSFKYPGQYDILVKYWRALDPIVRGQAFAWPTFFPIFEKLVKNKIKTLKTTGQLETQIWKHEDLIKYSAVLVEAYGKRLNELRVDEGMAKNVATLTKRGECPADFPYAFNKDDRYLADSCCNHDPYINNDVGKVTCTNRVDCPYDAGCYMHTNLHCKSNSDCMAFNKSLGEELKPGVKCDLLNGSCLYCPDGRQSPIGTPKCQWGAKNDMFKHPKPTEFDEIIP